MAGSFFIRDKSCCGIGLQTACMCISVFNIVSIIILYIVRPDYIHVENSLYGSILIILINLGLFLAAFWNKKWLLYPWLFVMFLYLFSWPIIFFGVVVDKFNFRKYALSGNLFLIYLELIIDLIANAYFTILVYSYYHQLKKNAKPDARGEPVPLQENPVDVV